MDIAQALRDPADGPVVLQPKGWPMPKGYANGMTAEGRILVTGGVVGWDESEAFPDGLVAQVRQTLLNIRAILGEGGCLELTIVGDSAKIMLGVPLREKVVVKW